MSTRTLLIASVLSIGLLLGGILLVGCAHQQGKQDKELDAKLAAEAPVANRAALNAQSGDLIATAPGLTDDQKIQFRVLSISTRQKMDGYRATSLKLRSILIKDMLAPTFDEKEVEAIKSRLRNLEDLRLEAIYDAVTKADSILGRQVAQNQNLLNTLIDERGTERTEKK